MKTKVCKSCGYVGKPIHDEGSSFFVDFFIWITVFAIAGITGIFPLIVIAPAMTLWHIAWFRTKKCPKCENLDMVRINSREGREILSPHEGMPQAWSDSKQLPNV